MPITLDIQRGAGKMQKKVAVLERLRTHRSGSPIWSTARPIWFANWDILAMTLDAKVTPELPDTRRLYGVVVAAIPDRVRRAESRAESWRRVIYEMNSNKVRTLGALRDALSEIKPGSPVALLVEHDGTLGYVAFSLE